MDHFANQTEADKQDYFELASVRKGLSTNIIEKDFWVCWTLKQLFSLPEIGRHLIFKGGTSLSKAYNHIERFSEDIDITVDKQFLGFSNDKDPTNAASNKKQQALVTDLSKACREFVQIELRKQLNHAFSQSLRAVKTDWRLEVDPTDQDGQSLLFYFPAQSEHRENQYIRSAIKIELGARGSHDPANLCSITPFIEEVIPGTLHEQNIQINTLADVRTFWEKAMIAHKLSHWPAEKQLPERLSRHYFDLYKLLQSNVKDEAIKSPDLLDRVSAHTKIYFRCGWAQYDKATQGSLCLIPNSQTLKVLEGDYQKMQEMFYGDFISWDEILRDIQQFETSFNMIKPSGSDTPTIDKYYEKDITD